MNFFGKKQTQDFSKTGKFLEIFDAKIRKFYKLKIFFDLRLQLLFTCEQYLNANTIRMGTLFKCAHYSKFESKTFHLKNFRIKDFQNWCNIFLCLFLPQNSIKYLNRHHKEVFCCTLLCQKKVFGNLRGFWLGKWAN